MLEAIVSRENGTGQMIEQNVYMSSYISEIELVLSKLYTDTEALFALELASLNRLLVSFSHPKSLCTVYFAEHFNLFRTRQRLMALFKPKFKYILNVAIQITVVASPHAIQLFLQIL